MLRYLIYRQYRYIAVPLIVILLDQVTLMMLSSPPITCPVNLHPLSVFKPLSAYIREFYVYCTLLFRHGFQVPVILFHSSINSLHSPCSSHSSISGQVFIIIPQTSHAYHQLFDVSQIFQSSNPVIVSFKCIATPQCLALC